MAKIVDGKKIANEINTSVKERIEALKSKVKSTPRLVSLTVGTSEDAGIYVNMQKKAAESVGIEFAAVQLGHNSSYEEIIDNIDTWNKDKHTSAIIVQKPLPIGISHDKVIEAITPEKDAEGIHPYNLGRILRKEAEIIPCTPGAVMKILQFENIELYGKEIVIIGHSAIVGKPLSLMLLNEMATTTVCHFATYEKGKLIEHTKRADIVVIAVGKPELVKSDWIKEGAIVIDVGINKISTGIVGDVDFEGVSPRAALITPVPGGVGPVTVSILMRNVFKAYAGQNGQL